MGACAGRKAAFIAIHVYVQHLLRLKSNLHDDDADDFTAFSDHFRSSHLFDQSLQYITKCLVCPFNFSIHHSLQAGEFDERWVIGRSRSRSMIILGI